MPSPRTAVGLVPRNRRDVDDVAPVARDHGRRKRVSELHHRCHVRLQHRHHVLQIAVPPLSATFVCSIVTMSCRLQSYVCLQHRHHVLQVAVPRTVEIALKPI